MGQRPRVENYEVTAVSLSVQLRRAFVGCTTLRRTTIAAWLSGPLNASLREAYKINSLPTPWELRRPVRLAEAHPYDFAYEAVLASQIPERGTWAVGTEPCRP